MYISCDANNGLIMLANKKAYDYYIYDGAQEVTAEDFAEDKNWYDADTYFWEVAEVKSLRRLIELHKAHGIQKHL